MQRWESFHVDGLHCGALFREITPDRLLTRVAFPLGENENYLVESVITRDGLSWKSMSFWQQPGDVSVTSQRGHHNNESMPGYGEFLLIQHMIADGYECVDFQAIIDSAPEGPPAAARMQLLGIDNIPTEDASHRQGNRIDVTIADTVTSSHWLEKGQIVASDWKGACSFLRRSADEALNGVDEKLVDFLREGRSAVSVRTIESDDLTPTPHLEGP